ncbi:CrcB protein [Palleronia marisminoris]|uniref:Fluoride-specific ion channel FluC n=1 Tax=Palleronia marisminoris TaxID=315423 RepID=A0A1Y5T763_9RHOB|nr:fluoride efflux transporter CrcB [Palleronia marisminoris]SFH16534.1 CrcB protein [Palleronia marisminoris]SLN55531.1 Putative fluoride ion transporter CrcB [Palleronia marisminoris]
MIGTLLQVAVGGAIGASARYLVGIGVARIAGPGMPLGVLTANVVGCLLMGLFAGMAGRLGLGWLGPFVATGILGGFTTFSTFSLEAVNLMQEGQTGTAILYMALSVGAGLGALYLGLELAKAMA